MSRIGKLPVAIPEKVTIAVASGSVQVKGPKGQLAHPIVTNVTVGIEDGKVVVTRSGDDKTTRAAHGLMRASIANMIKGVTKGFDKKLQVIGIGYRAEIKGKTLVMSLGYSHPVEFTIPAGVTIEADKENKITITGIDKKQVGQVAAIIRDFRAPDHYKGKGVRYVDEVVRLKAGKTA
jgi:large subunit ribosomal protein L6